MQDLFISTEDYGRVKNPYGSALLVDEYSDGYFNIVIPLENIPSPSGDEETMPYNILTEYAKGMTKGKTDLSAVTTDFFITKENLYRLDQLKGKVYTYMVALGNGVGYKFNAELSYRFNDVDNGDNLKGSLTLTPSSIGNTEYDIRPLIRQTLKFDGTLDSNIVFDSKTTTKEIAVKAKNSATATVEVSVEGEAKDKYTANYANKKITVTTGSGIKAGSYAMLKVTLKDDTAMGADNSNPYYAPYTMFFDLSYAG